MESLLILCVTTERKNAIKTLYACQGWTFENISKLLPDDVKKQIDEVRSLREYITAVRLTDANIKSKISAMKDEKAKENTCENSRIPASSQLKNDLETSSKINENSVTTADILIKNVINESYVGDDLQKCLSHNSKKGNKNLVKSKCERIVKCKRSKISKKNMENVGSFTKHLFSNDIMKMENLTTLEDMRSSSKCLAVCEETNTVNERVSGIQGDIQQLKNSESFGVELKKYSCTICSYETSFISNLHRHVRAVHSKVRYKCTKCDKSFTSKHEAESHEIYAHSSSLKCLQCHKPFTSRGGLLNHTKTVHLNKVLYNCTLCEAKFFYKPHYIGHMNKHKAIKPFSCQKCSKLFSYLTSCNLHERACTNEKYLCSEYSDNGLKMEKMSRVLCDICGHELSNKSALLKHHKSVHSEEPRSVCTICGKMFKSVYSLQRHAKVAHVEAGKFKLPCEVCGREFNQLQILRQHLKRHKKEFSVHCETCGKGFYSNYKLTEHKRSHTGEKPFSCNICIDFKCATKTNLLKHMKKHKQGRQPKRCRTKTNLLNKNSEPNVLTESDANQTGREVNTAFLSQHKFGQNCTPLERANMEYAKELGQGHYTNLHTVTLNRDNGLFDQPQTDHRINLPLNANYNDHTTFNAGLPSDSYNGNMTPCSTSLHQCQGLNILTAAMNIMNGNSFS